MANYGRVTGLQLVIPGEASISFSKTCAFATASKIAGQGIALIPRGVTVVGAMKMAGVSGIPNYGRITGFTLEIPGSKSLSFSASATHVSAAKLAGTGYAPVRHGDATFKTTPKLSGANSTSTPGPWSSSRSFTMLGQPNKGITFIGGNLISGMKGAQVPKSATAIIGMILRGSSAPFYDRAITVKTSGALSGSRAVSLTKGGLVTTSGSLAVSGLLRALRGVLYQTQLSPSVSKTVNQSKSLLWADTGSISISRLVTSSRSLLVATHAALSGMWAKRFIRAVMVQSGFASSATRQIQHHKATASTIQSSLSGIGARGIRVSLLVQTGLNFIPPHWGYVDRKFAVAVTMRSGTLISLTELTLKTEKIMVVTGMKLSGTKIRAGIIREGTAMVLRPRLSGGVTYTFLIVGSGHPNYLLPLGEAPSLLSAGMEE